MLKKKKSNYTQSFNCLVDDWILDTKKMCIVSKGKIDLQQQMNAFRDQAFDRIIDKYLHSSGECPVPCPGVEGQYGEFSSCDNASYLIELEDYLSQYDGELFDGELPLSEKKAIFDKASDEWLQEFARKQKEQKKAEIEPKKENENNVQEEKENA